MIKKFKNFVKFKLNENVEEMEDLSLDMEEYDVEEEDLPELDQLGLDMDEYGVEDEEDGVDIYSSNMNKLAEMLGVEVDETNVINYNGKQIIFPSETEMFHVDKKKFKTAKEVVDYLEKVNV